MLLLAAVLYSDMHNLLVFNIKIREICMTFLFP